MGWKQKEDHQGKSVCQKGTDEDVQERRGDPEILFPFISRKCACQGFFLNIKRPENLYMVSAILLILTTEKTQRQKGSVTCMRTAALFTAVER